MHGSMKYLAAVSLLGLGAQARAGDFVVDATVTTISSSRNGGDAPFVIATTGGSGPCSNNMWIGFYPTDFTDAESYRRAYAQVMMAMAMGLKVRISGAAATPSAANGDCWHANNVMISP